MTAARVETPRGRPRSVEADLAIAEAALDVLADQGIAGFSVEAVAQRAGVGKATVYRRYAGRDEVLAAALDYLRDDLQSARAEGSARERLEMVLDSIRIPMMQTRSGRIMAQVISASAQHPDFLASFYERVFAPRRKALIAILREGVAEGWVAPDADLDAVATMLVGPMIFLKMWHGTSVAAIPTEQVIDLALRGAGVSAPSTCS
ncbi:MAG: TetR/AcrR family transcriptional regulator [Candidatus Nanopelagicales bacterium]